MARRGAEHGAARGWQRGGEYRFEFTVSAGTADLEKQPSLTQSVQPTLISNAGAEPLRQAHPRLTVMTLASSRVSWVSVSTILQVESGSAL